MECGHGLFRTASSRKDISTALIFFSSKILKSARSAWFLAMYMDDLFACHFEKEESILYQFYNEKRTIYASETCSDAFGE